MAESELFSGEEWYLKWEAGGISPLPLPVANWLLPSHSLLVN